MDVDDIVNRFRFHAPKSDDISAAHVRISTACMDLSLELNAMIPDGREKSLVLTHLEEAAFWANAAIARHGIRTLPPTVEPMKLYYTSEVPASSTMSAHRTVPTMTIDLSGSSSA